MGRTTHYNLVLFEENDKPTWLNNWNQTMSHIDEVLYRISNGGGDLPDLTEVVARLEVLESQMSSANLQIQQNANNITDMQGSIETINTTLANLADADTALESEISGINTTITSIQNSLGTITTQLNNFSSDLSNAITKIDSVVNRVSTNETDIANVEARLDVVENSGLKMVNVGTQASASSTQITFSLSYKNNLYNNFKDLFDTLYADGFKLVLLYLNRSTSTTLDYTSIIIDINYTRVFWSSASNRRVTDKLSQVEIVGNSKSASFTSNTYSYGIIYAL